MAVLSEKSVLAIVPNWLGDVAMCTPALRAMHRRFGAFTVAGVPSACDLLEGLPWFRRIVPFPAHAPLSALVRTAIKLRPFALDLTVVFPHSFRSALLARLTGS
ncbi:MAG TPA: ADP-heptose--LPS heptosyltransferase, partial [Candidatus Hydrogenedentes bacterium]|nr:ADP-heptose--LPS heptosyltransferase [Candidatus Hydrogenedentota bacterium]